MVDQVRRLLRHPLCPTRRTKAPHFAGEGNEPLETAARTSNAEKASAQVGAAPEPVKRVSDMAGELDAAMVQLLDESSAVLPRRLSRHPVGRLTR